MPHLSRSLRKVGTTDLCRTVPDFGVAFDGLSVEQESRKKQGHGTFPNFYS